MSDAWEEIQQIKSKRNILRERLEKRKKERQDILGSSLNSTTSSPVHLSDSPHGGSTSVGSGEESKNKQEEPADLVKIDPELERELLKIISEVTLQIPTSSTELTNLVKTNLNRHASHKEVCNLLQKFSTQKLITIKDLVKDGKSGVEVTFIDVTKVNAMIAEFSPEKNESEGRESLKRKRDDVCDKNEDDEKRKKEKKEPKADIMVIYWCNFFKKVNFSSFKLRFSIIESVLVEK